MANCHHLETMKRGSDGTPYVVCEKCGETLRVAESQPPKSGQPQIDVRDFVSNLK